MNKKFKKQTFLITGFLIFFLFIFVFIFSPSTFLSLKNKVFGYGAIISTDIRPPRVINKRVSELNPTRVVITWETDEPSVSWIMYGLTKEYTHEIKINSYVSFHSIVLENLYPATLYHYQVIAEDKSGNINFHGDQEFVTPEVEKVPVSPPPTPPISPETPQPTPPPQPSPPPVPTPPSPPEKPFSRVEPLPFLQPNIEPIEPVSQIEGPKEEKQPEPNFPLPVSKIKQIQETAKIGATQIKGFIEGSPANLALKIVATTGIAGGAAGVVSAAFNNPVALPEIILLPSRIWTLLLMAFGIKKKYRPWGVVYDSVTKQPLDPAYVVLKDSFGKEVADCITDLDGRYGFLLEPGRYKMTVTKTNYRFPSQKLAGKKEDELYHNLYFGEDFEITKSGEVITKDIPMDPLKFDWNEFAKRSKKLLRFYSKLDLFLASPIMSFLFFVGFIIAIISFFFAPYPYNLIVFISYWVVLALREMGLKPRGAGSVVEKETKQPLSFAIISVVSPAQGGKEILRRVCNKMGRYYCLVPPGEYYIKIQKKNEDGSYSLVYTSGKINAPKGIINKRFYV